MNKSLITFENKLIKVLLKNIYKKIDVEITYQFVNPYQLITKELKIPTIGIGSSAYCDGQILVTDDMLGLSGFYPKFVKKYVSLNSLIEKAVKKYTTDVRDNKFPKKSNFLDGTKSSSSLCLCAGVIFLSFKLNSIRTLILQIYIKIIKY